MITLNVSGTSFSTPIVAGIASLLIGYDPDLANDDVEQIIRLSADDIQPAGFDDASGTGRVNAASALQLLQNNAVYHWSATGGSVTSSSGSEQRIFLGVSGLSDATYVVTRYEVEKTITFPSTLCNIIGAWGRGVSTTGYREEFGYCYGEGFCEIVPGTLTITGATLRTYVYDVYSILGQHLGYYPTTPQNVTFQYIVLGNALPGDITGITPFCNSETFSLPNISNGTSVTWSASPSGIVNLVPSGKSVIATKVASGDVILTAALSGTCSQNFTKSITTAPRITAVNSREYGCNGDYQQWFLTATPNFANATNWNWTIDNPNNDDWVIHSPHSQSTWVDVKGHSGGGISVTYEDPCGETSDIEGTTIWGTCGYSPMILPNPATNTITITTNNHLPQSKNFKTTQSAKVISNDITSIKEVQIFNTAGALQKQQIFSGNNSQVQMSIAGLPPGIYIVKISDGKHAAQQKLVIQ